MSHDESDMMHKLIDLQNFSVYLDTNATMLGNLSMSDLSVSSSVNLMSYNDTIFYPLLFTTIEDKTTNGKIVYLLCY